MTRTSSAMAEYDRRVVDMRRWAEDRDRRDPHALGPNTIATAHDGIAAARAALDAARSAPTEPTT